MLHRRDGSRFPPDVTIVIPWPKSSILVSSDQRILFLMVLKSLGGFWQTPSGLSCAFYWGVASVWSLYHKGLIGVVLQRWLSFWKVIQSPQRISGALSKWPSMFLVTSLTKALPPRLFSLAGRPALGRVLVVPNFFHLRMMESTVFLETFNADIFWYPSPICALTQFCLGALRTIPLTSWLGFCSDMHCQMWDLI